MACRVPTWVSLFLSGEADLPGAREAAESTVNMGLERSRKRDGRGSWCWIFLAGGLGLFAAAGHGKGPMVDFTGLRGFAETVTRADFEERFWGVYAAEGVGRRWIDYSDTALYVKMENDDPAVYYRVPFAAKSTAGATGVPETTARENEGRGRGPVTDEEAPPLCGWRVALDPGHIGGAWSRMEHRHFSIGEGPPVIEGDLVLEIAIQLRARLRGLGAEVLITREDATPVSRARPEDFLAEAEARLRARHGAAPEPEAVERLANRMFYVSAENRARARLLEAWAPDIVLCLHIDAAPWPDPEEPSLVEIDHSHVIVNGAYSDAELAEAEQRLLMVKRLMRGYDRVEIPLAECLADAFAEATGLPPFRYERPNARRVSENPRVWARNLAANRLFPAPTVFLEPYVANSRVTHARLQAGDYEGLREVAGKMRPSFFAEYSDAVVEGLLRFAARAGPPPFDNLFPSGGLNPNKRPQ